MIQNDIKTLWKNEIDKRVTSITDGSTTLISGEEVFRKIKNRLVEINEFSFPRHSQLDWESIPKSPFLSS